MIALALSAIVLAAGHATPPDTTCADEEYTRVPIAQLIANPEKWNDRRVSVIGFARLEYEGHALYASEHVYQHSMTEASIGLGITYDSNGLPEDRRIVPHKLDKQYVLASGVFEAYPKPSRAGTGSLQELCAIEVWELRR